MNALFRIVRTLVLLATYVAAATAVMAAGNLLAAAIGYVPMLVLLVMVAVAISLAGRPKYDSTYLRVQFGPKDHPYVSYEHGTTPNSGRTSNRS